MKRHVFHPAADADYATAATYYASASPEIGVRFFEEMERLIRQVRQRPLHFWIFEPPACRHRSTAFPYAVVYLERPDYIWIVAVMHGARRPGYWRMRLG